MTEQQQDATPYPFACPFCDYEFRKERYFGRHVFGEHPDRVVKDRFDPDEVIWDGWK